MQSLYPRLRKTDILVLATPVYVPLPGEMQNLINRLVPLMDPSLKNRNNRTRARLRSDTAISKLVLVSTSGWWELGNFGTVLRIAKEFAEDCGVKFIGALLRPHSSYLTEDNPKTRKVLEAAEQTGYQLVKEGKISRDLLSIVSHPLLLHQIGGTKTD